jgi:hypothetical protein
MTARRCTVELQCLVDRDCFQYQTNVQSSVVKNGKHTTIRYILPHSREVHGKTRPKSKPGQKPYTEQNRQTQTPTPVIPQTSKLAAALFISSRPLRIPPQQSPKLALVVGAVYHCHFWLLQYRKFRVRLHRDPGLRIPQCIPG